MLVRAAVAGQRVFQPGANMKELLVEGEGPGRRVLAPGELELRVQGCTANVTMIMKVDALRHHKDELNFTL